MSAPELARHRQFDDICNEFEDAWVASDRPDFLAYMNRVEPENAIDLLRSLLEVDVELRVKTGQTVLPDDYLAIHPVAPEIVTACLSTIGLQNAGTISDLFGQGVVFKTEVAATLPKTIGRYRLLEKIGEGAMGIVWKAEQQYPIRREVALKLIKPGLDSTHVIARFEAERQALAMMNHANIAGILDAGTAANGQPYFVMELVQGLALTTYCDQHRLGIDQRLRLFIDICLGLQHAHQKGIIHRDLKPTNLLVTETDGRAVPKVIDFGLAKALESTQRLTDESQFTGIGQILGTLKYMSPEQASLKSTDIDTRSDLYSLGAILYELLVGATPLDSALVREHSMLEVIQMIRERDAIRPSSQLIANRNTLHLVTDCRRTDSNSLHRILVGDLDWIVMKALEKERSRRYQTASELVDDINRYLHGEPVLARPPSASYRIRKFVAKNQVGVIAVGALAVALIAGIIGTSWGWLSALESDRESKQQFVKAENARVKETLANEQSQKRLVQIEKNNAILEGIFADLDIGAVKSGDESLEAVLAKRLVSAARQLEGEAVGDPLVVAKMQDSLGQSLFNLGFPTEASALFTLSSETLQKTFGPDDLQTLTTKANLASALLASGDISGSIKLFEEIYPIAKERLGDDHKDTTAILTNLAKAYHAAGNPNLAFDLYEQVFQRRKAQLGERDPATLKAMNGLAGMYYSKGQSSKALPLFEEVVRLRIEVLGETHKDTLNAMNNLAAVYQALGDFERAIPLFERTDRLSRAELGADHPNTLNGINNLASAYLSTGRADDAIRLLDDNRDLAMQKLPDDHPLLLTFMNNLARAYVAVKKFDLAVPLFLSILDSRRRKLGEEHSSTLITMASLAGAYSLMGDRVKSIPLFEEVLRVREKTLGRADKNTQRTIGMLGAEYIYEGRLDDGIPLLEEVAESVDVDPELSRVYAALRRGYFQANRPDDLKKAVASQLAKSRLLFAEKTPAKLAEMLESIGSDALEFGNAASAVELFSESLRLRSEFAPDDWQTFRAQFELGVAQISNRDFDGAELNLVAGYAGMEQRRSAALPNPLFNVERTIRRIIELYESAERPAEVQKWRERLALELEQPVPDNGKR